MKKLFFALALSLSLVLALPQAMRTFNSTNDMVSASFNPYSQNTNYFVLATNDMSYQHWVWWLGDTSAVSTYNLQSLRPGTIGRFKLVENLHWNRAGDVNGDTYIIYSFLTNYVATNSLAGASHWTNASGILRPIDLTLPVKITNSIVLTDGGTNSIQVLSGGTTAGYTNGATDVKWNVLNGSGNGASLEAQAASGFLATAGGSTSVGLRALTHQVTLDSVLPGFRPVVDLAEDNGLMKYAWRTNLAQHIVVRGFEEGSGSPNHSILDISQADTNSPVVFDQKTAGTSGYSRGFSFRTNGVEVFNVTGTGGPSSAANWTAVGTTDSSLAGTASASNVVSSVSVKWWGAVGNNVHDDTAAISNAIARASLTGGRVYLPAGVYLNTAPILIQTNGITLYGDTPTITYNSAEIADAADMTANGGTWINCSGTNGIVGNALRGLTIENIGFTNFFKAMSFGGDGLEGVTFGSIRNVTGIGNPTINASDVGIENYNTMFFGIDHVRFYNVNTGLRIVNQSSIVQGGNSVINDFYVFTYTKSVANGNNTKAGIEVLGRTPSIGTALTMNLITFIRPQVNSFGGDFTGIGILLDADSVSSALAGISLIDVDTEGNLAYSVKLNMALDNKIHVAGQYTGQLLDIEANSYNNFVYSSIPDCVVTNKSSGPNFFYGVFGTTSSTNNMHGVYHLAGPNRDLVVANDIVTDTLGIGVSDGTQPLEIAAAAGRGFVLQYAAGAASRNWGFIHDYANAGDFYLMTSSVKTPGLLDTARMVWDENNRIGMGNSGGFGYSLTEKLNVEGNVNLSGRTISDSASVTNYLSFGGTVSTNQLYAVGTNLFWNGKQVTVAP